MTRHQRKAIEQLCAQHFDRGRWKGRLEILCWVGLVLGIVHFGDVLVKAVFF